MSVALTSYSRLVLSRDEANATTSPTARPSAASRSPWATTSRSTSPRDARIVDLRQRLIDERRRLLADEVVFAVARDADDLLKMILTEELEPFPDRVLIRPEPLRHRLVDDDGRRRGRLIRLGEVAPPH